MTPEENYNAVAPELVEQIVKSTLDADGNFIDMLILLDGVCTGVLMYIALTTHADASSHVDALTEAIKRNLAEMPLASAVKGHA